MLTLPRFLFAAALAGWLGSSTSPASFGAAFASPAPVSIGTLEVALSAVHADKIRADLMFLASDELGGRDTPSSGLRVAARFLRARLERLGWTPGYKDGFLYPWYLEARRLDEANTRARLVRGQDEKKLAFGSDYFFYASGLAASDVQAELVFCGQGSKEDFSGRDLKGKVALCYESKLSWRERQTSAKEAGALGMVVGPPADWEGKPNAERFKGELSRLRSSPVARPVREASSEGPRSSLPTIYVGREAIAWLEGGQTWQLGQAVGAELVEQRKLEGEGGKIEVENVVGLWPGSDPELKNEVIILSAHYDHVGTRDGKIYNGADDNGSGSSLLLAVAEALAARGPLSRTVMLTWVAGEEKGLWGSEAWTKNPWLPEGMKPICDINIDMIGRNAPDKLMITPSKDLRQYYNGLTRLAEKNAPLEGFPVLGSADDYWHRSDHMNFAVNLKIPVCFLFSDVHEDYHQPGDDPEKIDYDKVRRVTRLVVRMLDGMQERELKL